MSERKDSDRERILVNIAALLASELASLQALPVVQEHMQNPYSSSGIRASYFCRDLAKGDLVVCGTSVGRKQHPWLISFLEHVGISGDPRGAQLRAIGTDALCDYGNESFTKITGIPERLLWEGEKQKLAQKVSAALKKMQSYSHRFRGLEFDPKEPGTAFVFIGESFGGLGKPTKPYRMTIKYHKRTTIKEIIGQMQSQGFGTRQFEPDDGAYEGPMEGLTTFKSRKSVVLAAPAG